MRTRFATWLVCGPLGHLAAGLIDWVVLLVGWQLAERRARSPSTTGGASEVVEPGMPGAARG